MPRRLQYLDALRGIAAMLVVVQHCGESLITSAPPGALTVLMRALLLDYLNLGKVGVVAFFAVSGFVIPFSFREPRAIRGFLVSRFFRLYPAYWASLLIAFIVIPLISDRAFTVAQFAANATMIQSVFLQPDVLGVYWTLFIELLFYLLCIFLYNVKLLESPRFNCVVVTGFMGLAFALAVGGRILHRHLPVAVPLSLAVMNVGTLCRMAALEGNRSARTLMRYVVPLVVVFIIPLCYLGWNSTTAGVVPWIAEASSYVFGLAMFIYCVRFHAFESQATVYLGKISFSLYLFHPIIFAIALFLGAGLQWPDNALVVLGVTVVFSVPAAALIYRLIEQPSINIAHKVNRRHRLPGSGST